MLTQGPELLPVSEDAPVPPEARDVPRAHLSAVCAGSGWLWAPAAATVWRKGSSLHPEGWSWLPDLSSSWTSWLVSRLTPPSILACHLVAEGHLVQPWHCSAALWVFKSRPSAAGTALLLSGH